MSKVKFLIAVDMQNDFIDGALGSKEAQAIVPNVKKKVEEYVKNNDFIIYTRDTHFLDNYFKTKEGQKLPVPHCIKDTPGWQINQEVMPPEGYDKYTIINKPSFGLYSLPKEVDHIACASGDDFPTVEIELVGLCTDICVVNNAILLKSYFYNIGDVSVDATCCAGITPELHEAALMVMNSSQIDIKRG